MGAASYTVLPAGFLASAIPSDPESAPASSPTRLSEEVSYWRLEMRIIVTVTIMAIPHRNITKNTI